MVISATDFRDRFIGGLWLAYLESYNQGRDPALKQDVLNLRKIPQVDLCVLLCTQVHIHTCTETGTRKQDWASNLDLPPQMSPCVSSPHQVSIRCYPSHQHYETIRFLGFAAGEMGLKCYTKHMSYKFISLEIYFFISAQKKTWIIMCTMCGKFASSWVNMKRKGAWIVKRRKRIHRIYYLCKTVYRCKTIFYCTWNSSLHVQLFYMQILVNQVIQMY